MPAVIQLKRGLLQNLPGLQSGEPGFTTDSYDLYIGLTSSTATNQLVGSGRFWTNNTTTKGSGVNLVEGTDNGTSYVTIASPDSLAGIVTYYMPGTQGATSSVLTNDGSGNLTWGSGSADAVFTGITTFSDTTDNTLGNSNTGSVRFDGGIGVDKNVTVGTALSVVGESYYSGIATFYDKAIFDSTNSIQIPVGNTSQRDSVGYAVTGQIRYNSELATFEGYGPGGSWGSLGGVKDVDGNTYIIPESSPGADDNILYFYNNNSLSETLTEYQATFNVDVNVVGVLTATTVFANELLKKFPSGDWGNFSSVVNDAFGQPISGFIYYDCLDEPANKLELVDLGVLT